MSRRGTAKGHEIDGAARVSNGRVPPPNRVRPGDRVTFINFEGDMDGGSVVRSSSAGLEHSRPVVEQLFLMSDMGGKWTLVQSSWPDATGDSASVRLTAFTERSW